MWFTRFNSVLSLILLLLGTGIAIVWWMSPELTRYLLKEQLATYGYELHDFSMRQPRGWMARIDRVSISSPEIELEASGIELRPTGNTGREIYLMAEEVEFDFKQTANDRPPSLNWSGFVDLVAKSIAFLPSMTTIELLEFCIRECLAGKVIARHEMQRAHISINTLSGIGHLNWSPQKSIIDVTGFGKFQYRLRGEINHAENSDPGLTWQSTLGAAVDPLTFHGEYPLIYSVELRSIQSSFSGRLPAEGLIDLTRFEQDLEGNSETAFDLQWEIKLSDNVLAGSQMVELDIGISQGWAEVELNNPVDTELESELFNHGSITVKKGSRCRVNSELIQVSCAISGIDVAGSYEALSFSGLVEAAKLDIHNESWRYDSPAQIELYQGDISLLSAGFTVSADNDGLHASSTDAVGLGIQGDRIDIVSDYRKGGGEIRLETIRPATELIEMIGLVELEELEIHKGEFNVSALLRWTLGEDDRQLSLDSKLLFSETDLDYQGIKITDANLDIELVGWPRLRTAKPAQMSWRTMNVGVPIEDMQMLFDLELVPTQKYYKLNGIDLSANLLDGTVNSKAFDYELTSQKGGFDLMIEEFALNRILALEEEDFESTGRISGSVPVHIEDGKLQVSDGVIFAIKPGGIIRYNASRSVLDMIEKNESLKVVIDAMSNFQYESLEADLQYSPEGILLAETRLVGNNPDYENGREIQLNLSLEENVGTLLKSLMFSEETSAKIGKKMKNGVRR